MKKIVLIISLAVCCVMVSFAQLKVTDNGKIGMRLNDSIMPLSPLSIGGAGDSHNLVHIDARDFVPISMSGFFNGLYVAYPGMSGGEVIGVHAKSTDLASSGTGIGLKGDCSSTTISGIPSGSYGVLGVASGRLYGRNYGVMGTFKNTSGATSGAGIIGTIDYHEIYITGKYAGYFSGDVQVTGTINGVNITSSDFRLKENITEIDKSFALNSILKMNPIEYNLIGGV
jgi:hypothetical protein